jgi:hypothetical protein
MTTPVRLQLSRKAGFNLQALSQANNGLPAAKVDRRSGFGNPFPITKTTSTSCKGKTDAWVVGTWNGPAMWIKDNEAEARDLAVDAFASWLNQPAQASLRARAVAGLRGKNLACWCKSDQRCHADVLLEFVNRPTCEGVAQ